MSAAAHVVGHAVDNYKTTLRNNRLGLWLFFISELFLFGGLLATRFYLWGDTRPELDQTVGLIVTVVLLISSFSMNLAETAIEHDHRGLFMTGLVVTAVLGTGAIYWHYVDLVWIFFYPALYLIGEVAHGAH